VTRFIIRLIALSLSFCLSTLAAALFITFVLFLGSDPTWLENDPAVAAVSFGFTIGVWVEIGTSLFAIFLFVILIAEFSRLSSLLFNTIAGGGLALVHMVLTPYSFDLPYPNEQIWIAALAAGFVGGLVHWALAGYRAGRWLGPRRAAPAPTE